MPIHLSPRPVRTMCNRARNSAVVIYSEIAAKGIVSGLFILALCLTPAN